MSISAFIHELHWEDIPAGAQRQARRCLLDTFGAAVGGRQTELSRVHPRLCRRGLSGHGRSSMAGWAGSVAARRRPGQRHDH